MKNKHIDKIRAKCIEANKSILELKFGCEISVKYGDKRYQAYFAGEKSDSRFYALFLDRDEPVFYYGAVRTISYSEVNEIDEKGTPLHIIGRPIRFADVLLAIKKEKHSISLTLWHNGLQIGSQANILWDLTKTFENQSEECLQFIADLL